MDLGCEHSKWSVPGLASGFSLSCRSCALQKMVESQRQNVMGEFERLHRLLAEEEQQLLQKLEEEELEVLPRLREGAARLGQQSTQLAALISELESRCQLPALGLLQVSELDGVSLRSPRGTSSVHPYPQPHCFPSGTQALYLPAVGLPRDSVHPQVPATCMSSASSTDHDHAAT